MSNPTGLPGDREQRDRYASLEDRPSGFVYTAQTDRNRRIVYRDARVHQDACVSIARHHASSTAITLVGNAVELKNRAKRRGPRLASPNVKIPVEIEVLVPTDAGKFLFLTPNVALDISNPGDRIHDWEPLCHRLDLVERADQFIFAK